MGTLPVNDRYEDHGSISLLAHDQYRREVAWMEKTEPLETEEEVQLLQRLVRAKGEPENAHVQMLAKHARERLVEGYQPLVLQLARRAMSRFRQLELLDLVNEGNIGLIEALDRWDYDASLHMRFSQTAVVCVRDALWKVQYESDGDIRIPDTAANFLSKMHRFTARFFREQGYNPSVQEVACGLKVSEDRIRDARMFLSRQRSLSLQSLVAEDSNEDRYTFVSLFQLEDQVEDRRQAHVKEALHQVLKQELYPQERRVVELRYGIGEGVTACRPTSVVAEMLGKSPSCVCGLDRKARGRIRRVLEPLFVSGHVAVSA